MIINLIQWLMHVSSHSNFLIWMIESPSPNIKKKELKHWISLLYWAGAKWLQLPWFWAENKCLCIVSVEFCVLAHIFHLLLLRGGGLLIIWYLWHLFKYLQNNFVFHIIVFQMIYLEYNLTPDCDFIWATLAYRLNTWYSI